MKCPICNGDTSVIDSRDKPSYGGKYRRRACKICGDRFTTIEMFAHDLPNFSNDDEALCRRIVLDILQRYPADNASAYITGAVRMSEALSRAVDLNTKES